MGKYIGPDNTYGLFEKQKLTIVSGKSDYSLLYRVPSSAGLLVVLEGVVLEPDVSYHTTNSGSNIRFSESLTTDSNVWDPTHILYVVYLGKQLSVTSSQVLVQKLGSDVSDDTLELGQDLSVGGTQVFKNGSLLRHSEDYTISNTAIVLSGSVVAGDKFDVYITTK